MARSTNLVLLGILIMLFAITVKLATSSSMESQVDASAFSAVVLVIACAGLIVGILGVFRPAPPRP